jgi:hypothetical protein
VGIEGKGGSTAENVEWVETQSAETHRLERWVSLTSAQPILRLIRIATNRGNQPAMIK